METIKVLENEVTVIKVQQQDYISLTDMLKAKDGDFFISDWLRNRNTVEYLGIWEKIHNPDFNYGEYAIIKSQVGLNSYKISVKEWANKTNAIGLVAKAGRYGGTYAHSDIAFEFGMWISAEFKIYLIKEFQRLKEQEQKQLGWDIKRNLTKINYRIHTDAIKNNIVPNLLNQSQVNFIYASEADILNVSLFGQTAKEFRDKNPKLKGNIRDTADVAQLVCLSNLESMNALFIQEGMSQAQRLIKLNQIAINQMKILYEDKTVQKLESENKQ
ncbi:KilA-N domain-containing protein [Sulfurimonas sp.]|uniref:KilA-N domain-containing protein n=1 Tax=Sulfurimonas sp. TaxID=2022749 RepID=UPI002AB11A46|nr:KilA-N domain-containing protein [Sulfurimonas sp.]